jgi:putative ATP-binding cassette transporter
VIIGMSLAIVDLNVFFNEWRNLFYNFLQQKTSMRFFACSVGSPYWLFLLS